MNIKKGLALLVVIVAWAASRTIGVTNEPTCLLPCRAITFLASLVSTAILFAVFVVISDIFEDRTVASYKPNPSSEREAE